MKEREIKQKQRELEEKNISLQVIIGTEVSSNNDVTSKHFMKNT